MRLHYQTVLFDFDGTLCATGEGITHCVALALSELGYPVPDEAGLRRFVGPPAELAYQRFCGMTLEQAQEAVRLFRAHYDQGGGWKMSHIYPGITELLRDLQKAGAQIATASSKPQPMVELLLQHMHIAQYFDVFCAAAPDGGQADKAGVIRRAMRLCGVSDPKAAVMIGDTVFDVEGAAAVGTPFVGAGYGYAGHAALAAAGVQKIADSPDGLRAYLFRQN